MYAWVNSLGRDYAGVAEKWRDKGVNGKVLRVVTEEQLKSTLGVSDQAMHFILCIHLSELKQRTEEKV